MKPLSPADAMFLMIEGRRQPMHVGGLQLFTPPAGAGKHFVTELVEMLRGYETPESPYNLRPVFRMGRWHWVEDEQFDLEHHFRHSSLPNPGRIRELLTLVSRWHSSMLDRSRPLWEIHMIEGLADKRFALYGKVHHAMFDGVAAMKITTSTFAPTRGKEQMPPWWAVPKPKRTRSTLNEPAVMNPISAIVQSLGDNYRVFPGMAKGMWELVRSSKTDPLEAKPYQAPKSIFNTKVSASRRFAAQSFPIARIKAVGKATGATLNDVVLAMCSGAMRDYMKQQRALPKEPLIAMVPVSVRAADGPEEGNQISLILANLATHVSDPGKRLQQIVGSTKRAKAKLQQMTRVEQIAYAAASMSPMPLTMLLGADRVRPPFNVVISNVPGPAKTLYWNGARLDEMYPVSIPIDGVALNITLTSYVDTIGFGYTACRRALPSMQRLLEYTETALRDLEQAAGIS